MPFVPDDFSIPSGLTTEHLRLRMLTPDVTALDYDALMSSRVRLRVWSDGAWPADDFTLAGNQADLEEHEREFHTREAFAYTVLTHDASRCDGCVYINPIDKLLSGRRIDGDAATIDADEHAAVVSFWVRDAALVDERDRELLDGLVAWLRNDWPFSATYFFINSRVSRDPDLYRTTGLAEPIVVPARSGDLTWQFWRIPAAG